MNPTILLPSPPYVEREDATSAEIIIEGLHPGYGVTLGNALRRVLFSSLPGAAVTRIKIDGVHHEFSTIPGVLEDVLAILLNLKQLRFHFFAESAETVRFEAKGERKITAGDIQTPSTIEIVNKHQHIATLTKKDARLAFEFTVERGVGYIAKEDIDSSRVEAGTIVLDAIFTPVRKVSYQVENMRVGTATDYNRLILSIDTDGSLSPRQAFASGLEILMDQLEVLKTFREEGKSAEPAASATGDETLVVSINEMNFSTHTTNALLKADIKTISDLIEKREEDLRLLEGVGDKALEEIHRELSNLGLQLKSPPSS